MRFIGNKKQITSEIFRLLENKDLIDTNLTLCDAFCGTGAVSESLKDSFNIIINDILKWSVMYSRGRFFANECSFENLGFNPFDHFNSDDKRIEGFFFQNYSPGGSERMYFSQENASRIDYFRNSIQEWREQDLISENEYCYLIASLIESVSTVSNTAGVYGAFLKHWDSRATKPIEFQRVPSRAVDHGNLLTFNDRIENIIEDIECDILYIDPPYTQNQYGTQYHLLETLVLDDSPSISRITGSRPVTPMRSDWSIEYKTHIQFDRILAKTKAKYIVFSYSQDGLMSKSFIEASLKRYGKPETYECRKISFKKYTNFKSRRGKEHFEYLFFVEKKEIQDVHYESPLNYIGSKAKMISEIKEHLPNDYNSFVDVFSGGFNVGININANRLVFNDINYFVKDLVESFRSTNTHKYILFIKGIIKKFGLEKEDAESYKKVREYYNSQPIEKRDSKLLYTVILYGFNQQIRFNGDHEFNNPVGMRWFNDKVLEKLISFSRALKEKDIVFESIDYNQLEVPEGNAGFLYMDPPYMLTNGAYNDGKRGFNGWNEETERRFFNFVDRADQAGKRFMISYVVEHRGKVNGQLRSWIEERGYRLIELNDIPGIKRKEVLIVNYH